MPALHARFLEPEALRAHLRAAAHPALAKTADTGALDDDAARALTHVISTHGTPGGALDLDEAGDTDWEARFVHLAGLALGDEALATQLLEGGWLDRRGVGATAFGALPLRIIKRQLTRPQLRAAREAVLLGWESELLNLLESSALRADRHPEEHVVLVREGVPPTRAPAAPPPADDAPTAPAQPQGTGLGVLLAAMRDLDATDLTLTPGLTPTAHGAFGSTPLGDARLTRDDVDALLDEVLDEAQRAAPTPLVHGFAAAELGRFRLTVSMERGARAATVRSLPLLTPTLDALGVSPLVQGPLLGLRAGLVLLSGEAGSGRSVLYASLLQRFIEQGLHVASLEEPLTLPLRPGPGAARQVRLGLDATTDGFLRASQLQHLDVVGFDLIDDARGLDLALDVATQGRLAVCTFRAANVSGAVHRASVLDARFHRRRLAEGLAAFSFQRLLPLEGRHHLELDFHVPTVALRRHLRAHETPPPPVAFENESVG